MTLLVDVPFDDRSSLLIVTEDRGGQTVRGGRSEDVVTIAATIFERAIEGVAPASRAIVERLRAGADPGPSEIVVEFGIVVRAEVGSMISKAGGEGNFSVCVTRMRGD